MFGALCGFAGMALFSHTLIARLTRTARIKRPHPTLVIVLRLWFGLLAVGSFALLLQQLLHFKRT